MVTLPQHGSNGTLLDIAAFLPHIDRMAKPDSWMITIHECLGDRALEIEALSGSGYELADAEFRSLYKGIYQTIDGHFVGKSGGVSICELRAVDSSFWEITGSQPFEAHMLATFGAWRGPR